MLIFHYYEKLSKICKHKKLHNHKKSQESKFQGTARFAVITTSFIDFLYCFLIDFVVLFIKQLPESPQICLLNICTKHLLFLNKT